VPSHGAALDIARAGHSRRRTIAPGWATVLSRAEPAGVGACGEGTPTPQPGLTSPATCQVTPEGVAVPSVPVGVRRTYDRAKRWTAGGVRAPDARTKHRGRSSIPRDPYPGTPTGPTPPQGSVCAPAPTPRITTGGRRGAPAEATGAATGAIPARGEVAGRAAGPAGDRGRAGVRAAAEAEAHPLPLPGLSVRRPGAVPRLGDCYASCLSRSSWLEM
jgi:hypothetical protein